MAHCWKCTDHGQKKKIAHRLKYRTSNHTKVPYSQLSLKRRPLKKGHLELVPAAFHCSLYLTLYRTDITLRPTLSAFLKVSVLERVHCIHRLFVSSLTF